jgi:hypothetical protein
MNNKHLYIRPRQTGKTTELVEILDRMEKSILITHNKAYAESIKKHYSIKDRVYGLTENLPIQKDTIILLDEFCFYENSVLYNFMSMSNDVFGLSTTRFAYNLRTIYDLYRLLDMSSISYIIELLKDKDSILYDRFSDDEIYQFKNANNDLILDMILKGQIIRQRNFAYKNYPQISFEYETALNAYPFYQINEPLNHEEIKKINDLIAKNKNINRYNNNYIDVQSLTNPIIKNTNESNYNFRYTWTT